MTTIMPEGEALRSAIKWISAKREEDPKKKIVSLINDAVLRFDLSPKDNEFLLNFFKGTPA